MTTAIKTLNEYRKQSGLKMKVIAAEMGVSVRYLRAWETGERPIAIHHFVKLMSIYGVNPRTDDILKIIPARTGHATATHPAPEKE